MTIVVELNKVAYPAAMWQVLHISLEASSRVADRYRLDLYLPDAFRKLAGPVGSQLHWTRRLLGFGHDISGDWSPALARLFDDLLFTGEEGNAPVWQQIEALDLMAKGERIFSFRDWSSRLHLELTLGPSVEQKMKSLILERGVPSNNVWESPA